jgi:predicted 2-oxoglutarate/Fe(II)-dependent dioxygenase YbiX
MGTISSSANTDALVSRLPGCRLASEPGHEPFACLVHNVFTPDECAKLIADTEARGYSAADVGGVMQTSHRDSGRVILFDAAFAADLAKRLASVLPLRWDSTWALTDVNECLRFLKYTPGQQFRPHMDGHYQRSDTERTFVTIQVYLNGDYTGGQTRLWPTGPGRPYVDVQGTPGMVLVFQHALLHSGEPVTSGTKYTLRTDVLYTNRK